MTSTNLRESVECWVLRIRKSADDLFVCSSCSIFCSMTANPISANVIIVNRTTKGQSDDRYLSASIELYWPFSWCRPSDPRAPASPLQKKGKSNLDPLTGLAQMVLYIYFRPFAGPTGWRYVSSWPLQHWPVSCLYSPVSRSPIIQSKTHKKTQRI